MYILLCADGSYYTGSTIDLERRLEQHQNGEGANHTKKYLPVSLLYYEEYLRIDTALEGRGVFESLSHHHETRSHGILKMSEADSINFAQIKLFAIN